MFNCCIVLSATAVTIKILLIKAKTGRSFQLMGTELVTISSFYPMN